MTFTIPNETDAAFSDQAEPDSRDFSAILAEAFDLNGVISGCAVTAQGTPDMTVAVASGTVIVDGVLATVTSGNVTITAANGTNPRIDLVVVDSAGAKSAVAGTAASNPVFPDPAGKVVLAAVYVPANDTTIASNQITDKRVVIRKVTSDYHGDLTGTPTGHAKYVRKTADESVTSSTVLQNDDALQFAVDANSKYAILVFLAFEAATLGDFKTGFSFPGDAAAREMMMLGPSSAIATAEGDGVWGYGGGRIFGGAGAGSALCALGYFFLETVSSGTFALQWAQGTSSGTATKVLGGIGGSTMLYWKLA